MERLEGAPIPRDFEPLDEASIALRILIDELCAESLRRIVSSWNESNELA